MVPSKVFCLKFWLPLNYPRYLKPRQDQDKPSGSLGVPFSHSPISMVVLFSQFSLADVTNTATDSASQQPQQPPDLAAEDYTSQRASSPPRSSSPAYQFPAPDSDYMHVTHCLFDYDCVLLLTLYSDNKLGLLLHPLPALVMLLQRWKISKIYIYSTWYQLKLRLKSREELLYCSRISSWHTVGQIRVDCLYWNVSESVCESFGEQLIFSTDYWNRSPWSNVIKLAFFQQQCQDSSKKPGRKASETYSLVKVSF